MDVFGEDQLKEITVPIFVNNHQVNDDPTQNIDGLLDMHEPFSKPESRQGRYKTCTPGLQGKLANRKKKPIRNFNLE